MGVDWTDVGLADTSVSPIGSPALSDGNCYRWVLTLTDHVGNSTQTSTAAVLVDTTAPAVNYATPNEGATVAGSTDTVMVSWAETEASAGIASRSSQRQKASIVANACPTSGWSNDGAAVSASEASVASGGLQPLMCYRWVTTVVDDAGNGASFTSGAVKTSFLILRTPVLAGTLFSSEALTADLAAGSGATAVTFLVDGVSVGTANNAPFGISWDSTVVGDGDHTVQARTTIAGVTTTTDAVHVNVANALSGPERVDADQAAGHLSTDEYALYNLYALSSPYSLPTRYVSTTTFQGEAEEVYWSLWPSLSGATQDQITEFVSQPLRGEFFQPPPGVNIGRTAPGMNECVNVWMADLFGGQTTYCEHVTAHAVIVYTLEDGVTEHGVAIDDDGLLTGNDADPVANNGVPDQIDSISATLEESFAILTDPAGLNFRNPIPVGEKIRVTVQGTGSGLAQAPLPLLNPGGSFQINKNSDDLHGVQIPHELFHEFEYGYDAAHSLLGDDFWYEANAQWAAHEVSMRRAGGPPDFDELYQWPVHRLLSKPWESFEVSDATQRQYGLYLFAEYMQDQLGTDSIRQVWEQIDNFDLRVDEAIAVVAGQNGSSLHELLDGFAVAEYRLTGTAGLDDGDSFDDVDAAEWRASLNAPNSPTLDDATNGSPRPARDRIDLDPGNAGMTSALDDADLGAGGSYFVDLDVPDGLDGNLELTLWRESPAVHARLVVFDEYPAECDSIPIEFDGSGLSHTTLKWDRGCKFATIVFSHTDPISEGSKQIVYSATFGTGQVTNGVVTLGVNPYGDLNVEGNVPSTGYGGTAVGLRFNATGAESLSTDCQCEGWGITELNSGVTGWANEDFGAQNLRVTQYFQTATGVFTLTDVGGLLYVSHDYHPSTISANLYEIHVMVTNHSADGANLRYRRVMDWDIDPTAFSEYVTIGAPGGILPASIIFTSDDGFASPHPLAGATTLYGNVGLFQNAGPHDIGALFDIDLGFVASGDSVEFTMFYGAASNEAAALAALSAVGVEIYSTAKPNMGQGPTSDGSPNTFMFGIKDLPFEAPLAPHGALAPEESDSTAWPITTTSNRNSEGGP